MSVHVSMNVGGEEVKIRKKIKVRTFSQVLFHRAHWMGARGYARIRRAVAP